MASWCCPESAGGLSVSNGRQSPHVVCSGSRSQASDCLSQGILASNFSKLDTIAGSLFLACVCVCVCVCVYVCVTMEKVPDEWQARQAIPAILQVSSSKHNAKKITTRVRGPFHQSITAILTEEKREAVTNPTHVAVYLFQDQDQDRSRL